MTELRGRWPIWDIRSAIRLSAMSCNAMLSLPPRSASARQPGRPSFGCIWRCWRGPTSLTAEVLTLRGLVTYYVLFFIHLESRRVDIAGITVHPDGGWMQQIARNVTMEGCGALRDCRYLLHDRDSKYTQSFRAIIASGQVEPLVLPARSPNLKTSERSLADRSTGGMGCKEGHRPVLCLRYKLSHRQQGWDHR